MKKNIFITGGAGYVGAMLIDQMSRREDVDLIITVDKEEKSDLLEKLKLENSELAKKIIYIQDNLANSTWQHQVSKYPIDVVIHTAWQIRAMYGKKGYATTWHWNIDGSNNVFDLVFQNKNKIPRLIYFSTVASYGAFPENSMSHFFKEEEAFRIIEYIYAEEKKAAEENLQRKFIAAVDQVSDYQNIPEVVILRPAAISGPRGRYSRIRFGLQANLQGKIKGGFLFSIIKLLTTFVPATSKWVRQFIHEDDVVNIITLLAFQEKLLNKYDVFNISPPGNCVFPSDMARAVQKKILWIWPCIVRIAFTFFWHISRGRIPTCAGSWRGYSYPIVVDGSKLTKKYNFNYQYSSHEAFTNNQGVYKVKL